jgi:chromosome segregation ATPase
MGPMQFLATRGFRSRDNLIRKIWDASNELGSLTDKQLGTYIESKGGDISLNDIRINGAKAHQRVVGIENQIAQLEAEQKQFAEESGLLDQNWVVANKDTDEYQQKLNKYNTYLSQIQDLYQQLNEPFDENLPNIALKDIDEAYKADFV